MSSLDSVAKWRAGEYDNVVDYCLKDSQLTYDLWKYGQENGVIKFFDEKENLFGELEVKW